MNIALAAGTFALVVPAELPDKTFISAIVLSSRYRAVPVFIGAASGLILQAVIAVLAGRLLALLPHRTVDVIVAVLFFAGSAYLLFVPERSAVAKGTDVATESEPELDQQVEEDRQHQHKAGWRIALTTFGIIALAEFGDLTQILIANLSARSRDPWSVFLGAAVAFLAISVVSVAAGRTLTRVLPLSLIRKISGIALAGLGIWSAVGAAT